MHQRKKKLFYLLWLGGITLWQNATPLLAQTQLDLGYEASRLTQNQASWQQQSLQLTQFSEKK